jgi:hypothetical protein
MERWVFDPRSGGTTIPEGLKAQTKRRILAHAEKRYVHRYTRFDIRFKGALCYVDAFTEPETRGRLWKATGETREPW